MKPKIFVTRKIPQAGLDLLATAFQVDVWEDPLPPSSEALRSRVAGCQGILSLLSDTIDQGVMDAAGPQLKGIANYAVGYNNIDVSQATQRGIQVGNTPDVLTEATADIALLLMLGVARHVQAAMDQVRRLEWKTWEPLGLLGQELRGKTLGVIGMGRIGQAVAKRCHGGWQMEVLYSARQDRGPIAGLESARRVEVDELLRKSDFVTLHADLNPSTRHLINRERLSWMKPSAILINTARGGHVDQEALYDALSQGKLWGAGLDVTDPEPLPSDSPLRSLENCLILPHIGSATYAARDSMARMAAENLIAAIGGKSMPYSVSVPKTSNRP
ncbi:MAG: 2-hydroxyacid dehydrogenase [Pirellulaceae bacterium]